MPLSGSYVSKQKFDCSAARPFPCRIMPMLPRIPISFRRSRRLSTMHPTPTVFHRAVAARFPAPPRVVAWEIWLTGSVEEAVVPKAPGKCVHMSAFVGHSCSPVPLEVRFAPLILVRSPYHSQT